MPRRDILIHGVGDSPSWPGQATPQSDTVTPAVVSGVASLGSSSVIASNPVPNKVASGLYSRAGADPANPTLDLTRYNNNAPADHIFFTINWSAIQPNNNTNYVWSVIDNAMSAAPDAKFTLRLYAGGGTPGWAKTLSGGNLTLLNGARGISANCPYWWTAPIRTAWRTFMSAVAARYDGDHRVTMISAPLQMIVWAEPFILGGVADNGVQLWNAGFQGQQMAVDHIAQDTADLIARFPNTLVELCASPGQMQFTKSTGITYSRSAAQQILTDMCTLYGSHLCITDYGFGPTDTPANHAQTAGGTPLTEADPYWWLKKRRGGAVYSPAWAAIQGPVIIQYTMSGQTTGPDHVLAAQNALYWGAQGAETMSHSAMTFQERADADAAFKANEFGNVW